MKKIFTYILALAAFASCSTAVDNDFVANGTTFTAPMEISVAESRAFDADLNWSWETTDVIAAYQNAGEKSVNALALNAAGNFYNEAFTYATEELAQFHFVYPASQLGADYSLTVAQTGAWTPVLYGTVEAATVANLGTVEMNYLSSAFEVRVWETGRAARKNIVKAVLSSEADFVPTWSVNSDLTYTQSLSGKVLSLELNSDTAIFNLGEGDFAFNLELTDTEGETLTYELAAKNFVAGKRTILNVEWREAFVGSAAINSWYEDYANNGGSALEGGAIYVTAEGGEAVVAVNGETKSVVDGKISGLASGTYNVVVTVKGHEVVNRSIVVTSIPTVNATIQSSYSKNGSVEKTNNINGTELQVTASLSDDYVAKNLVSTAQAVYGSTTSNISLGSTSKFSLALGQHNCYAKVTLGNGYVCATPSYTTYITGIPYTLNPAANDSWNAWTPNSNGNVAWNQSSSVRIGYNLSSWTASTDTSIEKSFYLPTNTTVVVNSTGTVTGSGSKSWLVDSRINTTFTLSVSGSTAYSVSSTDGGTEQSYSSGNKSVIMTSSNPVVKLHNSYSTASGCTKVKTLTIKY